MTMGASYVDHQRHVRHLAQRVADAMDDGWSASPPPTREHPGAYIVHTGGRSLFLAWDWPAEKGRLQVSGRYPGSPGQFTTHTIGVAASRSPAAIARDIERRLLPAYDETWAKAAAWFAAQNNERDRRVALAAELAALLPGARVDDQDRRNEIHIYWRGADGRDSVDMTVRSDPRRWGVDIQRSSMSPEKAKRLATILGAEG